MSSQLDLIAGEAPLKRSVAMPMLEALIGQDLRPLAEEYGITVWRDDKRNKGWAGQTVERYLGQRPNSAQAADFGDWELKVVPLVLTASGGLRLKETMAVTMFTAAEIETREFEESHLLEKLRSLVVVGRTYEGPDESRSFVLAASAFDLVDEALFAQVREVYEEIRWMVREHGIYALSGHIGTLVEPRPKGSGNRTGGVGFYARKAFVAHMLKLDVLLETLDGR